MLRLLFASLFLLLSGFSHGDNVYVSPSVSFGASCANGKDLIYINGAATCSTGTPTMGACGTSPSVTGTDFEGIITAGSGVLTACTLNFSKTLSSTPKCVVTTSLGAAWITSISSSSVTIAAASLTSGSIYYKCWGAS